MPVRIINGLTASLGNPCISGSWGSVNSVWISGYIRDLRCPYVSVFRQQNSQLLCLNVENKHLNSDFFFSISAVNVQLLLNKLQQWKGCRVAHMCRMLLCHDSLVLIFLHSGCLSSGGALFFIALAPWPLCWHRRRASCHRGCLRWAGVVGGCGHHGPALCMALTMGLSREDLKGSMVPAA